MSLISDLQKSPQMGVLSALKKKKNNRKINFTSIIFAERGLESHD